MKVKALVNKSNWITQGNLYETTRNPDEDGDIRVIDNVGDYADLMEDEYEVCNEKEKPMKYCNAVKELTTDQLNHIVHMLTKPEILHQTICRANEEFNIVNLPEDIRVVFPEEQKEKPMKTQKFKAYKMKIENPEHSKVVQEVLFKLGYWWYLKGDVVHHCEQKYLYTDQDGEVGILFDNADRIFDEHPAQELDVSWMNPVSRETVEVNGKVYYKDEIEIALEGAGDWIKD